MNEQQKSKQRNPKDDPQPSGGKNANPETDAERDQADGPEPADATLQQAGMPRNPQQPDGEQPQPDHGAPRGKADPTLQQAGMPRQTDAPDDEGRKDLPGTD